MIRTATVLVADDDEDIRELVRTGLERVGYRVIAARDGSEALRLAIAEAPDLCILDVAMPGLDGFEVTAALREGAATHGIEVILLTAHAHASTRARGVAAGADAFLSKPFRVQVLRDRVAFLLDRGQ